MKTSVETLSLRTRESAPLVLFTGLIALAALAGCPFAQGPVGGNVNGNDNTGTDEVTASVVNFNANFGISSLQAPISVLYTVTGTPSSIAGFFLPVADDTPGAAPIGDRVIIATNLPAGQNRTFSFDPRVAGTGFYRVGVLVVAGGENLVDESDGVVQVQGPPEPLFIQPSQPLTEVVPGTVVTVSFDTGDPEGDVHWRLFSLRDTDSRSVTPDQLGSPIALGTGNVGVSTFSTVGLTPGDYQLGVSATDTGLSINSTVTSGQTARIVTEFGPTVRVRDTAATTLPQIAFTAPGPTDVALFRNETYLIRFSVTITEPGATGLIELFYDDDVNVRNGFRGTIVNNLPSSAASHPLPTNLPEGTWFLGATVRTVGGLSAPVTAYAIGKFRVVRDPTLVVTAPNSVLPFAPGVAVGIAWITTAPTSAGVVDVFARAIDPITNLPSGSEISILTNRPMTTNTASFTRSISGIYEITVRLEFVDGATKTVNAPQRVRISSQPRVLWVGSIADDEPTFEGAIFGGVNFEDNAGTSVTSAGDLNGDAADEILIGARYAKPFFSNPSGIGHGEAYLVYGRGGDDRITGEFDLNSLGTSALNGVTFAGVRTRQDSIQTDGLSSVGRVPDVDGDGRGELVFGFPEVASRGHNVSTQQNGVVDPRTLMTLEREDQFLRGGVVIVSSDNSILGDPLSGTPTMNLDLVGQDFESTCVEPEPGTTGGIFGVNVHSAATGGTPCAGTCAVPQSGGKVDASNYLNFGFASALSRDYFYTYVYSADIFNGVRVCSASADQFRSHECLPLGVFHEYCVIVSACEPFSPGLHRGNSEPPDSEGITVRSRVSGFYVQQQAAGNPSDPIEPLGARIIGVGLSDKFGASLTVSNQAGVSAGDIIISAPNRTGRSILLGPDGGPEAGGEIDGLVSAGGGPQTNPNSGVAYLFQLRSLWTPDAAGRVPPRPHQYIVGEASHSCGGPDIDGAGVLQPIGRIDNIDAIRIAGRSGERITNILGIGDYNNDNRNDFAVGAPASNGGQGRVYICYRRQAAIEGDYVLEKLALAPNDPQRLTGMLIATDTVDGLGSSLATDVDFNGDGISDLAIGSPNAGSGVGEVIIVFGNTNVLTPQNGITVTTLLQATRTAAGRPVAARIRGNPRDSNSQFGFNVANAGDVNGDGLNDLLIAAPNATPRFDDNPADSIDELTQAGLDLDFNGAPDDVSGPLGYPDGVIDGNDQLLNSGVVYVIYGSNRLDNVRTCSLSGTVCSIDLDCPGAESCSGANVTVGIDQLGSNQLRGFMIVGRRRGDRLGGGDAGEVAAGGISTKTGKGRSQGLASAGDADGDGRADILIGAVLADPRVDPNSGQGIQNGGEAYLIYGTAAP